MADPRSNGHGERRSANLGPLIIAAGIVLAGVIVAFAVLATRSGEPGTVITDVSPQPVAIAPPVSEPPVTTESAGPVAQGPQETLTATLTAAQGIREATGNYADATSFELATRLPGYTFLPASNPSNSATQISYFADGNTFAAAALADDGTCYWIKDDRTTSTTTYGSGPICTGNSALSAADAAW